MRPALQARLGWMVPRTGLDAVFEDIPQVGLGLSIPYRASWLWEATADLAAWTGAREMDGESERRFSFWHARFAAGLSLPLPLAFVPSLRSGATEVRLRAGAALHAVRGRGTPPPADHHWFYADGESEFGSYLGTDAVFPVSSRLRLGADFRCDFVFTAPRVSRIYGLALIAAYGS